LLVFKNCRLSTGQKRNAEKFNRSPEKMNGALRSKTGGLFRKGRRPSTSEEEKRGGLGSRRTLKESESRCQQSGQVDDGYKAATRNLTGLRERKAI